MSGGSQINWAGPEAVGRISPWTLHLSVLGGLLLVLGVLNWQPIAAAVTVWWVSPTFSHCFLIIPVSAWLIWGKRHQLSALTPSAWPRALWFAIPVIAVSFVGTLASVNELQQLALMAFVQILALAVLGPAVYRTILFPSLYLFFLVPMGEYLIGPLQRFTTSFIDVWLGWLGILHYTEGNVIQLANGTYQVAEACAGLRFLIATIAVGTLFAHFSYRKWHKIGLFLIVCVIVPIIGNGFRALGIVLLAHFSDNRIAVGADHLIYGWGFSVAILAVLMYVGNKFADPAEPQTGEPPPPVHSTPVNALPIALLIALVAISAVPAFAAWRAHGETVPDAAAFAAPPQLRGWSTEPVSRDWAPLYADADAHLQFAMRDANGFAPAVDVFVAYYTDQTEGRSLISSQHKMWDEDIWHPVREGQAKARFGDAPVQVRELLLGNGGTHRLVWWTYVSNGAFTTSAMDVKLNRVRSALLGGNGAAMIAVSTLVDSDLDAARARLQQAAMALGPVKARIDLAKKVAQH